MAGKSLVSFRGSSMAIKTNGVEVGVAHIIPRPQLTHSIALLKSVKSVIGDP